LSTIIRERGLQVKESLKPHFVEGVPGGYYSTNPDSDKALLKMDYVQERMAQAAANPDTTSRYVPN
jgi:hypothetical protein